MSDVAYIYAESIVGLRILREHMDTVLPICEAFYNRLSPVCKEFDLDVQSAMDGTCYKFETKDKNFIKADIRILYRPDRSKPVFFIDISVFENTRQNTCIDTLINQRKVFSLTDIDQTIEDMNNLITEFLSAIPKKKKK